MYALTCRCEDCLLVVVEKLRFVNNTATDGAAFDINNTTPYPVIITDCMFDGNEALTMRNPLAADNSTAQVAVGNGGGVRCLGGNCLASAAICCPMLCWRHCVEWYAWGRLLA